MPEIKNSNFTASFDVSYICDTSNNIISITLPTISGNEGKCVSIIRNGINNVIFNATISGCLNPELIEDKDYMQLAILGGEYKIIGSSGYRVSSNNKLWKLGIDSDGIITSSTSI